MQIEKERFVLESIFSGDKYETTKNRVKTRILSNFSERKKNCQIVAEDKEFDCDLGYVLLNLILLRPYRTLEKIPKYEDLYTEKSVTQDKLEKFFNKIIDEFENSEKTDYNDAREEIQDILDELSELSASTTELAGNSLSYLDFVRLEKDNAKAREIFHKKIPYGMQYNEIEEMFGKTGKECMKFFEDNPDTDLYPYAVSGTGLNKKQLCQAIGFVGLKPSLMGDVIPVAIEDNYLLGLKNIEEYIINAMGTRLALVTNHRSVRSSGYLTRKLSLCMLDTYHDDNLKDCGTKHTVKYDIDKPEKQKMIIGRHYYEIADDGTVGTELKTVSKNDDLLGKSIALRSPVTCCGEHICATCYGKALSEKNKQFNTGMVAVLKLTEPLTQTLLSAKHLLTTNTNKIEWGPELKDNFVVNMNEIFFDETEVSVRLQKPSTEDFDEDEDAFCFEEFDIVVDKKATHYKSPTKLYINMNIYSKKIAEFEDEEFTEIEISNTDLSEDEFLFKFNPQNNELTKSLQQIINLIENGDHEGCKTYDEIVNKFADLMIENHLNHIMSIHLEMIVSQLIKDKETNEKPDFSKETVAPYVINRVSKTNLDGPLSISLAFERLNDQLADLKTYKKNKKSIMDKIFQ